jgi:hypothetical protein
VGGGGGGLVGLGVAIGNRGEGGVVGAIQGCGLALGAILLGKFLAVALIVNAINNEDDIVVSYIADVVVQERREAGEVMLMPEPEWIESLSDEYPSDVWREAQRRWSALTESERAAYREVPQLSNPDFYAIRIADEIVYERQAAGETIEWPEDVTLETAWREAHYPAEIWAEAVGWIESLPPEDRAAFEADVRSVAAEDHAAWRAQYNAQDMSYTFKHSFNAFDVLWMVLAVGTAIKLGAGNQREAA